MDSLPLDFIVNTISYLQSDEIANFSLLSKRHREYTKQHQLVELTHAIPYVIHYWIRNEIANQSLKLDDRFPEDIFRIIIAFLLIFVKYTIVVHPGALCKKAKVLNSEVISKLHFGTVVTVEEVEGRRCRITSPNDGWLSMYRCNGDLILQKGEVKSAIEELKQKEKKREDKVNILKSIATVSRKTCRYMLNDSDWNLKKAIDAFYRAKYEAQEDVIRTENRRLQERINNQKRTVHKKNYYQSNEVITKILILKEITNFKEDVVKTILAKSAWNLRLAIEAFYIAKYRNVT
eukprot:229804_1